MPSKIVKEDDLENEDDNVNRQDEETEKGNNLGDDEGGDENWSDTEFEDIEFAIDDLKAVVEETLGLSFDDDTFELLVLSSPAITVACGDGILKKAEMEVLADTILYAYYGDEDYANIDANSRKSKIAAMSKIILKLVENFDTETDYGTIQEALLDLAADSSMDEGADEFVRYTLHEVVAADGKMAMGSSETLEEICEMFGYEVEDILAEYED